MNRKLAAIVASSAVLLSFASCSAGEYTKREELQKAKKDTTASSLERVNLEKKRKQDENANQTGYVYLMSFSKPIGYYVVKGKISSNGSQLTPEQDIVRPYSGEYVAVDGPQDDGSYGEGDPGIFFFTSDGTMVTTSLDYVYSTQPIPTSLDVPKLG